jgi:anti-sigma B factor antagonist
VVAVSEDDPLRLADAPSNLEMQVLAEGGQRTLVFTGELDLANGAEVEAMIRRLCAGDVECLVIDLSRLRFIDSTGIRLLMVAASLCEQHGQEYRLVPGPQNVQRVFEIVGLDQELPFAG